MSDVLTGITGISASIGVGFCMSIVMDRTGLEKQSQNNFRMPKFACKRWYGFIEFKMSNSTVSTVVTHALCCAVSVAHRRAPGGKSSEYGLLSVDRCLQSSFSVDEGVSEHAWPVHVHPCVGACAATSELIHESTRQEIGVEAGGTRSSWVTKPRRPSRDRSPWRKGVLGHLGSTGPESPAEDAYILTQALKASTIYSRDKIPVGSLRTSLQDRGRRAEPAAGSGARERSRVLAEEDVRRSAWLRVGVVCDLLDDALFVALERNPF